MPCCCYQPEYVDTHLTTWLPAPLRTRHKKETRKHSPQIANVKLLIALVTLQQVGDIQHDVSLIEGIVENLLDEQSLQDQRLLALEVDSDQTDDSIDVLQQDVQGCYNEFFHHKTKNYSDNHIRKPRHLIPPNHKSMDVKEFFTSADVQEKNYLMSICCQNVLGFK